MKLFDYNLNYLNKEEILFYKFILIVSVVFIIYISYFTNTNYLIMILIILVASSSLYNVYNTNNTNNINSSNNNNSNENSNENSNKYLNKYKNISIIYNKDLLILKEYNNTAFNVSISNMNICLYLLSKYKYNYNNISSNIKLYRDEALNQLKSIRIDTNANKKTKRYITKKINTILNITDNYILLFENKQPTKINNLYTFSYINHPSPNNLQTIDYSPNYSLY